MTMFLFILLSTLDPVRHFLPIVRGIFLEGEGSRLLRFQQDDRVTFPDRAARWLHGSGECRYLSARIARRTHIHAESRV